MTVTGYLSEYSLPEILHLLELSHLTGQLRLLSKGSADEAEVKHFFIWFRQGRIITAFNRLGARNLVQLIHQRRLLSLEDVITLLRRSPVERPFGLFLKEKGVLTAEQLQGLFSIQVVRQVRSLFTLEDAWFRFREEPELPYSEMTGISIQATEVILPGLRALKSWTALESRLPDALSGLSRCVSQLTMRLKTAEKQVLALANGKASLQVMAKQLKRPLSEVQQIAFCLINAGLVEEVPLVTFVSANDPISSLPSELAANSMNATNNVSQVYLDSLEDYLKKLN